MKKINDMAVHLHCDFYQKVVFHLITFRLFI